MATVAKGLPGRYAKFLTAAAGIGIVYAQNQFGASNQWVQLAVAVAAALGVLAVPNTPAATAIPPILPTIPWTGPVNAEYAAALKAALANITPGAKPQADVSRSADPPMDHLAPPVT